MIDMLSEALGVSSRYMNGFITGVIFTGAAVCIVIAYSHIVRKLLGE